MQNNTLKARCYHASNFASMLAPPVTAYTTTTTNQTVTTETVQCYTASIDASMLTSSPRWSA